MADTFTDTQRDADGPAIPSAAGRALDLAEVIRARPTEQPERFTLDVPDGLHQGRGAWGGVATGAMTSAAMQVSPPGQSVRTMSAQLVGPLPAGPAEVRTEVLRVGSATTTVASRVLTQSGDLVAHAVVVLGAARSGAGMPGGPDWRALAVPEEVDRGPEGWPVVPIRPPAPEFLRQVEIRPTVGLPFSGSPGWEASGWLQPVAPVSRIDEALLVALSDTWWIAVVAKLDRLRPAATVGFACELPGDPAALQVGADGRLEPLFHRGRLIAAREGFTVETRELWTSRGELLTWNTQTAAVIA